LSSITVYLAAAAIGLAIVLMALKWFKPRTQSFQSRPFQNSFQSSDPNLYLKAQLDLTNQKIDMAHGRLNDLESSLSNESKPGEYAKLLRRISELEKRLAESNRSGQTVTAKGR